MKVADRSDSYLGKRPEIAGIGFTLALVFACFTLASTSYLAWLYRLVECAPGAPIEAITMEDDGNGHLLPRVHHRRCIGCGSCEYHCPAQEKAIRVVGKEEQSLTEPGGRFGAPKK